MSAYSEGYQAYFDGDYNPYEEYSSEWYSWEDGNIDAAQDN